MLSREFDSLRVGSKVVIIKTGELGVVTRLYRADETAVVVANRCGLGLTRLTYHYIELCKL